MFLSQTGQSFGTCELYAVALYASLATLKIGLDILLKEEDVKIDSITGHGGLFKNKGRRTEYSGGSHERADFRDGDGGRGRRLGHGASGGIHAFQKRRTEPWGLSGQPGIC